MARAVFQTRLCRPDCLIGSNFRVLNAFGQWQGGRNRLLSSHCYVFSSFSWSMRAVLIWWVQGTGVRHPCNDLEGALWMVSAVRAWDPEASICCAYAALAENEEDYSDE